ncbi:MAG: DUF2029 domain-containing protein [Chloroflexi bacterium]|nr:DUF2029 domain-containing protein [Chloroflexota bacterium]
MNNETRAEAVTPTGQLASGETLVSFLAPAIASTILFAVLAPITVDVYNSINQRTFMDLWLVGNPYSLKASSLASYGAETWVLDWPYPPLAMLFVAPAWLLFRLFGSEGIYQVIFKLPLFLSALATAWLLARLILTQGGTRGQARWAAFFFLLNPGIIINTSIAGYFEAPTILLVVLAYWWWAVERRVVLSGLALGFAIALRLYPAVLLPVFMIEAWRRGGLQTMRTCLLAALAPALVTSLPFAAWDIRGFWATLSDFHFTFGHFVTSAPFSTFAFVSRALLAQFGPSDLFYRLLGYMFVFLTLLGLGLIYLTVASKRLDLSQALLATLLVFFLLYPKGHGLYILAVLPFALLQPSALARWVWVPGTVWMLLFNGALGSNGLLYWFTSVSGREWDTYALLGFPGGIWRRAIPFLLMAAQTLLVSVALWLMAKRFTGTTAAEQPPQAAVRRW